MADDVASEAPPDARSTAAKVGLGALVVALGVVGALVGVLAGTPHKLPGAALGAPGVLYVERAVAVFVVGLLVLVVVWRAFEGRLPDKLSGRGVEYTPRAAAKELREEALSAVAKVENINETLEARVDALELDVARLASSAR